MEKTNQYKRFKNSSIKSSILILVALMGFVSGPLIAKKHQALPLNELRAFSEAYYRIKSAYIEEIDDTRLIRSAIRGMVSDLDKHSYYLSPKEFSRFNSDNEGEYAGLGLTFNDHKYGIEIDQVLNNSPAKDAGFKKGMIVTHINKESIQFISAKEAFGLLEGKAGSSVTLTIADASFAQPKDFKLTRKIILIESVSSRSLPAKTGYVAISQFTLQSLSEFKRAISKISNESQIENLIIDLRDNPGGVMEIAVEISDLFITQGTLLSSSGRASDANEVFYASQSAPLSKLNVLVMINGGSASAAEIVAAALQDHEKAVIFGEQSYGKGSIQSIFALSQDSGMKLTTAEYFSPKGNKIQNIGVKPDVKFTNKKAKNTYNISLLDDPVVLQAFQLVSQKH